MEKINHTKYHLLQKEHLNNLVSKCNETESGCFVWEGAISAGGYGNQSFRIGGKRYWFVPHRAMYVLLKGPTEMELDHLCRNRLCCNVNHLETVSSGENTMRGNSFAATNKRKTHCKNDHEFTEKNTWRSPTTNRRRCRTCDSIRKKRYQQNSSNERWEMDPTIDFSGPLGGAVAKAKSDQT